MMEEISRFEQRKKDHIRYALKEDSESLEQTGFNEIELFHEAVPDIDFNEISSDVQFLDNVVKPMFVSSMTAGHSESTAINERLAQACQSRQWIMGVGSQRRQLYDDKALKEWQQIRKRAPKAIFLGNIGIAQLKGCSIALLKNLIDSLEAVALFVHTNPVQECLQKEGTPYFKDALFYLERACKELQVPVILKETGCGISESTARRLNNIGVYAVDVAGYGGTHWGRVEGARAQDGSLHSLAAQTFRGWGISTVDSLRNVQAVEPCFKVWASGGVRTGLDVAKLLAAGAEMVGLAKPLMQAAIESEQAVLDFMERVEFELKIAMFCTGSCDVSALREEQKWRFKKV